MKETKEILEKSDSYSFCSYEVKKKTGKECGIFYHADDVEIFYKAMKEYADWKIKECVDELKLLKIKLDNPNNKTKEGMFLAAINKSAVDKCIEILLNKDKK